MLIQAGLLLVLDLETRAVDTVTTSTATEAGRFSPDGRWLAYTSRETGDVFSSSPPRPLFVSSDFESRLLWYGVSADGERFLYPALNQDAKAREIHVVVNWFEELRTR